MADTQTNLHQFFKTKKNVRSGLSGKNVKRIEETEGLRVRGKTTAVEEEETVIATPPVTPKRKRTTEEEVKRKRRRSSEKDPEDDINNPKTPQNNVSRPQPVHRSAKKRLIMGTEQGSDKQNSKGLGASPTKQLKKGISKLTPSEVRERLGRCGRLDELRARLLSVNQCGEKLKQFRERTVNSSNLRSVSHSPIKEAPASPQIKKFSSLSVEVPVSPLKTPVKTPIKTPSKTPVKEPAYQRLQHLAQKPSEELVLPFRYRVVKEVFRAVDTVVSLLHNRQEVITYSKLKPAVQEMLRRTFSEQHLGQIKTVFPLAYFFKQDLTKTNIPSGPKSSYQLTVSANLDYKAPIAQNLAAKFDGHAVPSTPKYRKMDSIVLVERRNIFHNLLLTTLKEHHEEFLQSLDPPIPSSSVAIKRWHPEFPLEEIPDIEAAELPKPPVTNELNTAKDVLERAHGLFSVNPRLERAVIEAAAKSPVKPQSEPSPSPAPPQTTSLSAALKGVSSSLLEKIRAREAAKTAREMTRSSGENKELEMLSRLPVMARIIRNIFITEKKAALPWEMVATKVAASFTSMLPGSEVDQHLELLIKEVPGWCVVHKVRSGIFLKINRTEQLSVVTDKLEAVIKKRR
ncbi:hypothetical protein Pmani_012613 [Petrolisthes manimaculis]|uniref:CDT1 Geminin-binding domain-containing protein n=1 Tax=Petrolisthes manimaculis TaxID=1843537 RepID=A0AAE1PXL7_9EUCA|nr:hypothetical protein Pmani_012613 [Petrolisthes manimaculis]